MRPHESRYAEHAAPPKKPSKYTPVSRRQDRPDAIAWFVRNHPEVTDAQIAKVLSTTKSTIDQVRNRTHWNATNIKPVDPVSLGLMGQLELDALIKTASDKRNLAEARKAALEPSGASLKPSAAENAMETESLGVE